MKFTKLRQGVSTEWMSITSKGTYFINKSTSPNLGIVFYTVSICLNDGGFKRLGVNLEYLRDAKKIALDYQNNTK